MKAAVLAHIPSEELQVVDVPEPVLPGDVLLSVEACGICGTDLHIMEGLSYRPELPLPLGHEPVGRVIEVEDPRQPRSPRAASGAHAVHRLP